MSNRMGSLQRFGCAACLLLAAGLVPARAAAVGGAAAMQAQRTGRLPIAACRASPRITQQMYAMYVRRFNARDERYAELYAENVVFEHGKGFGTLHGPREVVGLYRKFWRSFDERIVPGAVIIDNSDCAMAVELSVRLVAKRNGVALPSVPGKMKAGDEFVTKGVVLYRISAGKITHIRGAIDGVKIDRAGNAPNSREASYSSGTRAPRVAVAALESEPSLAAGLMTRQKYLAYLGLFNRDDPRYADFYDACVAYAGPPFGKVHGRGNLVERFRVLHRQLREQIVPREIVIDDRQHIMAVELVNHVVALRDGVRLPAGTLNRGDGLILKGVVIYGLANGRIRYIRDPIAGNELIPARKRASD